MNEKKIITETEEVIHRKTERKYFSYNSESEPNSIQVPSMNDKDALSKKIVDGKDPSQQSVLERFFRYVVKMFVRALAWKFINYILCFTGALITWILI